MAAIAIMTTCLLAAAPPAGAEDPLSPPQELPVHDGRDAYAPAAAFVKDGYLVVWQSGNLAPGDLRDGVKYRIDLVGCLVDKTGKVLSKEPFVICKADEEVRGGMKLASDGKVALLVWHDLRNGKDWDVYAARVTPEGASSGSGQAKVLDPDGFLIAGGPGNQSSPTVAWDGKNFVVAYQGPTESHPMAFAVRVSVEGKVLDSQPIRLAGDQPQFGERGPLVLSGGTGRSIVVRNRPGMYGGFSAVVNFLVDGKSDNQQPLSEPFLPIFGAAAAGRDLYLVTWLTERPAARGNGRIDRNVHIIDGQGKATHTFTLLGEPHRILQADVAWDGTAFVAAWTEWRTKDDRFVPRYQHVLASRISPEGKLVGTVRLLAGARDTSENWATPRAPHDTRRWGYAGPQYGQAAIGAPEPPAMNAAVASDGAGTTIIAYEQHPETGDVPIRIAYRTLRAK